MCVSSVLTVPTFSAAWAGAEDNMANLSASMCDEVCVRLLTVPASRAAWADEEVGMPLRRSLLRLRTGGLRPTGGVVEAERGHST